jgi:hypothetical protein
MSVNAGARGAIAAAGGVPPLVAMLASPAPALQASAADALYLLSYDDSTCTAIGAAGGIPPLLSAADALYLLSYDDSTCTAIGAAGGIPPLLGLLSSRAVGVADTAEGALYSLSFNGAHKAALVAGGGIPRLIALLAPGGAPLHAASALGNLCVQPAARERVAVGGIPPLVRALADPDGDVQAVAAGALRNLSSAAGHVDAIVAAGAVTRLVSLLASRSAAVRRGGAGAPRARRE